MTETLENPAWRKIRAGGVVTCMSVRMARGVEVAILARSCGFDAIYLDILHSAMSIEIAGQICLAANLAGIASFVRVPDEPGYIARVLDNGALGVIVPQVDNAEQARRIASECRFPPRGQRSVPGVGAMLGYRKIGAGEAATELDEATMVVAMIETPQAAANAAEIAAVPGIDCLLVGSNDLKVSLAAEGRREDTDIMECYRQVADGCRREHKIFGIAGVRNDAERLADLVRLGARFFTAGNDEAFALAEGRRQADFVREACEAALDWC
ncbi:MAG: aldolase/citrate lyase family protein [Azospirillaceae bacterium]